MPAPAPASPQRTDQDTTRDAPDGLMVFDGVCNFCSGYVRLMLMMDREATIRFTPVQSPYGWQLCLANGVDPDDPATFLFFDGGRAIEATDAMAAMLARLPAPWRWLSGLRAIPRPLRDRLYRWVARNRYRLLGKRRVCMVPDVKVRSRFIQDVPPGGA